MIEHRPTRAYLFLLLLVLAAWCLHDINRLGLAAGLLILVGISYRVPQVVLRPGLVVITLLLALSFAFFNFVLFAADPAVQVSIYSFRLIQSASLSLLLLTGLQWFSWRSTRFDWLLFSLGGQLMLSGVSWQTLMRKPIYIGIVLAFMGVLLVFRLFPRIQPTHARSLATRQMRSYYGRLGLLLAIFLSLSLLSIRSAEYVDRHFSELLTRLLIGNDRDWSGFSGHTHLQGGKEIQLSDQLAFTVSGPRALDYWRGNILTIYRDGHWFPQENLHLPVSAGSNGTDPGWERYQVDPAGSQTRGQAYQVQMQNHYHGILFVPSGTQTVEVPAQTSLYQNQYQLLRRELSQSHHQYRLWIQADAELPARWDRNILQENLEIAPRLSAQLAPLARRVSAGAAGQLDRASRIESWFRENFVYSLRTGAVTPGMDPTVDFVLGRKPAYCSWFASGMVLMLRSLGIPAHVVSGWRSMDWNPIARVWVVKEKEAHDWVEVLDAKRNRWVRFDPTPPGQLEALTGSGGQSAWWSQLGDGLGILAQRLQSQLTAMSLQQRLESLRDLALGLLRQPAFYGVLLLLLGLNQLFKRRRRTTPASASERLSYAGADAELSACLERIHPWLSARGLDLPQHQTLEAWGEAASSSLTPSDALKLAQLIQLLQACRFGPDPAQSLPELRRLSEDLAASPAPLSPQIKSQPSD
ncbi:MAG: hypothetical protein CVV27_01600 [Candidatus Melainabacteria bacterium HGW-Melainabacteria-1]|nr:MAG: hypothetical protein CVV27_01600 [Candidatus Melainabacteria bacterium HGW-Melainabacteria-1]